MNIMQISKYLMPTVALSVAGLASAMSPTPPLSEVYIQDITYNGSGCPIGTVAENISPDKTAFTVTFSDYIAEAGPNVDIGDSRRNCQLTLDLHVPQGWQFSLGTFDYRGYVYLDKGMRATHSTSYYFQGRRLTGRFSSVMNGEIDEDYTFTDRIGFTSLVWSDCNASRALNINTGIRVRNTSKSNYPNAEGLITNDSIDGQITHKYGIRWRRCS